MSLLNATIGPNAPDEFNVVIEIPRGSTNKYEVEAETGLIKLDRVLYSPLFYPCDYGYIPQTRYLDGDPTDVLVLVSHATFPGCIVEAVPIGVILMTDDKGPDEKIIAVAKRDPRFGYRRSIDQLNEHTLKELVHFFEVYKDLEEKSVEVRGTAGPEVAKDLVQRYRLA